jgi:5-formyltetrahydrofolate cyclo-ligase
MDKSAMRSQFRQKRDDFFLGLTDQDKRQAFSIAPSMLKSFFKPEISVAAYIAIDSEPSPLAFLRAAHEAGCKTALPYITSKVAPMQFLKWSPDDTLEAGPFGLQQPNKSNEAVMPDVILVPLVAFDRRCARLGQGAGHYDRALSLLDQAVTIGVAWSIQETDYVPTDPWDIPLNYMLTEKEWITP